MNENRWQWTAIALVASGAMLVCGSTLRMASTLGAAQWGVYLGGVLILLGLFWFRRRMTFAEQELESQRRDLERQREEQSQERREFQQLRLQLQAELETQAASIDQRQQALTRKLANWHQWLEYPEPFDVAEAEGDLSSESTDEDEQLRQLGERDRKLNLLLDVESKVLFENIRTNKYVVEGLFQPSILRDDAYVLIEKVARVYVDDAEHPLTETSIDQLVRAASRVCLHLLVVLEQLPVKVQHYNLRNLYGWVKQGVKAYGVYQSARPYMPYVNSAYYLSRYAMGSNPYTLLAWWVASEVTTRSASAAAQHLFNQKALAVLNDVVRVIGYEVATMYDGNVRHRDANWIYAVELTQLVSQIPFSREGLVQAMKEIGAVQLVNEYDRVFLYRCLAAGKSAQPAQYKAKLCLSSNERRAVAMRLEKYYRGFASGLSDKRTAKWMADVEDRLGIKLDVGERKHLTSVEQAKDAVRSLTSLLVDIKQREGSELAELLAESAVLKKVPSPDRESLLRDLADNPPFFFEQPDLDPAGEIATLYLNDLVHLALATEPRDVPVEPLIEDVAAYLRVSPKQSRTLIDQEYVELFRSRFATEAVITRVDPSVARAFLYVCESNERVRFVYGNIQLQWPVGEELENFSTNDLWLIGTDQRLLLILASELPALLWIGDQTTKVTRPSGQWTGSCILTGGTWTAAPPEQTPPAIIARSRLHQRFQDYFGPLLRFVERRDIPKSPGEQGS